MRAVIVTGSDVKRCLDSIVNETEYEYNQMLNRLKSEDTINPSSAYVTRAA